MRAVNGPVTFRPVERSVEVGASGVILPGDLVTPGSAAGLSQENEKRQRASVRLLMRVHDGKILEVRGHYSDQTALDAFWET